VESPKFNRGCGPGFRPKNNQGNNRNDQGAEALNGWISRRVGQGYKCLKVTGSDVENPRQPRQSRLKAIFEAKME